MEKIKCHDCGVVEGQLHKSGCDMERCPKCGEQLISCSCTNEEVEEIGYRIPYVQIPVLCMSCGRTYPNFFNVPDEEWKKYVIPELQKEVLCIVCYKRMKILFPNGWREISQ